MSEVYFKKEKYYLKESDGKFNLPILRKGDLSKELMVICYTESGNITEEFLCKKSKYIHFKDISYIFIILLLIELYSKAIALRKSS